MRSVAVHDRRSARLTRHPVGPLGPDRGRWCAPPLLGSRWGRSRAPAGDRSSPGKRRAVRTWWAQPSRGGLMSVCAARVPRRPAAAPRGGTRRQRPVIAGVSALEERRVPVGYRASKGRSGRARPTLVAAGSWGVSLHRPDLGAIQGQGRILCLQGAPVSRRGPRGASGHPIARMRGTVHRRPPGRHRGGHPFARMRETQSGTPPRRCPPASLRAPVGRLGTDCDWTLSAHHPVSADVGRPGPHVDLVDVIGPGDTARWEHRSG